MEILITDKPTINLQSTDQIAKTQGRQEVRMVDKGKSKSDSPFFKPGSAVEMSISTFHFLHEYM